ncbi:hypothetical protein [Streptomyces sp. NBC_01264]|uniref:hypothetical protein n=1 Tax=Streptomyces sp. NBC_01264 TaxID=2903804 RepID=UPI002253C1FA|nr:hypothetical protein [Streptomyces sp. NBC_01264]MCX4775323.1 hypothetical protein [Streptomyces sp. NBC_01264]
MSTAFKVTGIIVAAVAVATAGLGTAQAAPSQNQNSAAAKVSSPCVQIQHEVDEWLAGNIYYFADPRPAWLEEARENECTIQGFS